MHVQPRSKSATAQSGQEPKAVNGAIRRLDIASEKPCMMGRRVRHTWLLALGLIFSR